MKNYKLQIYKNKSICIINKNKKEQIVYPTLLDLRTNYSKL